MDDEDDIADDDIQQHNTAAKTTSNTNNTTTSSSTAIPRNVSLQLFELTKSDAATVTTAATGTAKNDASLPSLAHSSASSATHLYEMAEGMMILEE